jgi:hypothetical protein
MRHATWPTVKPERLRSRSSMSGNEPRNKRSDGGRRRETELALELRPRRHYGDRRGVLPLEGGSVVDEAEVEYRFQVGDRKVQLMLGPDQRKAVCDWLRHYRTKEPLEIETPTLRLSRAIRPAADPTTSPSYGSLSTSPATTSSSAMTRRRRGARSLLKKPWACTKPSHSCAPRSEGRRNALDRLKAGVGSHSRLVSPWGRLGAMAPSPRGWNHAASPTFDFRPRGDEVSMECRSYGVKHY